MAKNISKYLAGVSVISLFANLFAPMISLVSAVDPMSTRQDVVFNVNIAKILTVSITAPEDSSTEIDEVSALGNAEDFITTSFMLNVQTNNLTGYQATMTTSSNTTALQHNITSDSIANLESEATGGDNFPANFWGFSLNNTTYQPLMALDADKPSVVASKDAGPVEDSQRIYFGMKADNTKTAGDYSNTVLLTVVTKYNPIPDPTPTPEPDPTPPDNGNSASSRSAAAPPQSTESTTDDSSDSGYVKPQGVLEEIERDESINGSNAAASAALGATAVVAAGVIFFVLAKRREDDEEEEEV